MRRDTEPGEDLAVLDIEGRKVGFTICEDLWNDKGEDHYAADRNPYARYRKQVLIRSSRSTALLLCEENPRIAFVV